MVGWLPFKSNPRKAERILTAFMEHPLVSGTLSKEHQAHHAIVSSLKGFLADTNFGHQGGRSVEHDRIARSALLGAIAYNVERTQHGMNGQVMKLLGVTRNMWSEAKQRSKRRRECADEPVWKQVKQRRTITDSDTAMKAIEATWRKWSKPSPAVRDQLKCVENSSGCSQQMNSNYPIVFTYYNCTFLAKACTSHFK